jgi:hypothetical protein
MPPPSTSLQDAFVRVVRDVSPKVVQMRSGLALRSGVVFARAAMSSPTAMSSRAHTPVRVTLAGGEPHGGSLVGADKAK